MSTSSGADAVSYSKRACKRRGTQLIAVRTPRHASRWLCTAWGNHTR